MNDIFNYIKQQIQELRIFNVVYDDLTPIKSIVKRFEDCGKIIVIGTGGSSLGGKCLVNFEASYNGRCPRVIFLENVDSRHFLNVMNELDQSDTGIIVISKSGKTTETMMLFLTILEMWPNFDYHARGLGITESSESNDLKLLADTINMPIIDHDPNIGGRFSVFSVVGLLPALLEGCDIDSFINGAKLVLNEIKTSDTAADCGLFNDILSMYKVFEGGQVNQHVMMTYSDLLDDFGKWFVQLIGESLGKSRDFGITPVRAIGTIDQHSMLQLFLAGPANKLYTVVTQRFNEESPTIKNTVDSAVINHLRGHTIHDLMLCHQKATIEVLKKQHPVRVLEFDEFNIETLGFLMILSMVEIVTLARLAKINPFDQPTVEEAKNMTMRYMMVS
ncbi:MAG: hypothetical protein LBJ92_03985 [Holosporales bacterium]|jgi:glucose-6-phosphate isomerase|nr:hypothetical protein [Holosporales bacterium]